MSTAAAAGPSAGPSGAARGQKRGRGKDPASAGGLQAMAQGERERIAATFTRGLVDLQLLGAPPRSAPP